MESGEENRPNSGSALSARNPYSALEGLRRISPGFQPRVSRVLSTLHSLPFSVVPFSAVVPNAQEAGAVMTNGAVRPALNEEVDRLEDDPADADAGRNGDDPGRHDPPGDAPAHR